MLVAVAAATAGVALAFPAQQAVAARPSEPAVAPAVGAAAHPRDVCGSVAKRPWCNKSLRPSKRARLLEAQMTRNERIDILNGVPPAGHTGKSLAIPRLGIPSLDYTDGPVGPRQGKSTAMPVPMALAATFDTHDASTYGNEVAREAKDKGNDAVFGPTVNLMRTPEGGRTYEAFGEDPYLVASTTVPWIKGAQRTGVMAVVKHFVANNQEGQKGAAPLSGGDGSRSLVNVHVSDRVLHEVYFTQFEAAVKMAHTAMLMCSYNQVNSHYACQNHYDLQRTLEKQWGFKGIVLSDYGAAHNVVGNLNHGLDFEPSSLVDQPQLSSYYAPMIKAALASGAVTMKTVDYHVFRILRTMFAYGVFDRPAYAMRQIPVRHDAHIAEKIESNAIVLLRNHHSLLPLRTPHRGAGQPARHPGTTVKSVAVIGPYANRFVTGGGSGDVTPVKETTDLAGIRARLRGTGTKVRYASGMNSSAAIAAAKKSSVAVVIVGDVESEGQDKSCIGLNCSSDLSETGGGVVYPCHQTSCPPNKPNENDLIDKVAAANKHTIVVLETGAPVLTPWRHSVQSVVEAWYPGEQGGPAIAGMLFGDTDPSGRLPVTFPEAASQLQTAGSQLKYPGVGIEEYYSEGVDVGYRWYAAHHYTPAYSFGSGLSYTHFSYSGLRVKKVRGGGSHHVTARVSAVVTNTGHRAGVGVPELYLSLPSPGKGVTQPPLQLAGYGRVSLRPGHSARVSFPLNDRSFGYYRPALSKWLVAPGCYAARIGSSATSLPLRGEIGRGGAHHCGHHAVSIGIHPNRANHAAVLPPPPRARRVKR